MPTWPGSLPQKFSANGYEETLPDLALRTKMDKGKDKIRRRFTAGVRPVKTTIRLDGAQKGTLETFYTTTLIGGSLSFDWVLPGTATTAAYRFVSPPKFTPLGSGNHWNAALDLEVLP